LTPKAFGAGYGRSVEYCARFGRVLHRKLLGMIDAALGRKEDAIREGRRAVELLPVAKDSIAGAGIMKYLGIIYAWTGEKNLAIDQVAATLQIPSDLNYGKLRLHPFWDPLRGDPRFEKLVASLAPKPANK